MPAKQKKKNRINLDFIDLPQDPHAALKRLLAFEFWGLVIFGLTIIYILGLTGSGGTVGEILISIMLPIVGIVGAWYISAAMISGTVHLFAAGKWPVAGRLTKLLFTGLVLFLGAWECALHRGRFYWDQEAREATGYIGLWTGRFLRLLVGDSGLLLALALIVALAFIIMKISPRAIYMKTVQWIKQLAADKRSETRKLPAVKPQPDVEYIEKEINGDPGEKRKPEKKHFKAAETVKEDTEETPVSLPAQHEYKLPPEELLLPAEPPVMEDDYREFASERIVNTLETFGIPCHVNDVITGPAVTRVEVVLGEGIRVNKVEGMEKDIAYTLPAKRVRVEAPIPGKTAIGIEFPNIRTNLVRMREIVTHPLWKKARAPLTMAIAKNLNNEPMLADLGKMPHLLVAGQTGSGKSVCLHSIITSLLYRLTPDQLRLILIDPKMVEFGFYEGLPHLLTPVVNDVNDAVNSLRWSVQEMRDRYKKLKSQKARDIQGYNQSVLAYERMPYIVIVIDEMADLMAQEGFEIETCITSLTQLARAVGIHLILATQRPSVKIITGNIKGNIPARIALNVASYNDSRTILDYKGAETLLGNGDMLFKPVDADTPIRAQGVYVADDEIRKVVEFLSRQGVPEFDFEVTADHAPARPSRVSSSDGGSGGYEDTQLTENALKVFLAEGEASTSMLQSKLKLGYPRARRLMTELEELGFIGPKNGSKPRDINISACQSALSKGRDGNEKGSGSDTSPSPDENNVDEILSEVS